MNLFSADSDFLDQTPQGDVKEHSTAYCDSLEKHLSGQNARLVMDTSGP